MAAEIEEEEKNINNNLFKGYFTSYQSPNDMYKKFPRQKVKSMSFKYMQSKKC